MVIAAAESAVGLAIILAVFRSVASVDTAESAELKW
jgi:NADH:ubiquinone oxidoreductase subunit K